jgi:uncharacterized protein
MSMSEDNKRVVLAFAKAIERGDWDSLGGMMTDDATWWVAGSTAVSGELPKARFIKQGKRLFAQASGPMKFELISMTAEEDRVAVEARSNVLFKSGGLYKNEYHFLFKVCGGKISSGREYMDTLHLSEILRGLNL